MTRFVLRTLDYPGDGGALFEEFHREPYFVFFDSSLSEGPRGRYSFFMFNPFELVKGSRPDTLDQLKARWEPLRRAHPAPECTPFFAGIAGYVTYDHGRHWETTSGPYKPGLGWPEVYFGFYDTVITLDHQEKKVHLTALSGMGPGKGMPRVTIDERLNILERRILSRPVKNNAVPIDDVASSEDFRGEDDAADWRSNFTKEEYLEAVERALSYIAQGEIYQVNLSQRFEMEERVTREEAVASYQRLRRLSPSHFSSYLDFGDYILLSSSPERFLWHHKGQVQTRPMKGTRPRGRSLEEDERLRRDMLESAKEKAELLMVTDLERNDLGKVCAYGSVRVTEPRVIETYETVFQATATVEGRLRPDKDCFDLLKNCFPSGSISGCPKIRAMDIIAETEPHARGVYTGAIGYVGFDGTMDMSMAIRTMAWQNEKVCFHVGGGIVADSVPEMEYEETLVKARAMRQALQAQRTKAGR